MSEVVKNKGPYGGHYLKIDGEIAAYIASGTAGEKYKALVEAKEAAEKFEHVGETKIKTGDTELKVSNQALIFGKNIEVLFTSKDPGSYHCIQKWVKSERLPEVVQALGDFIDEETVKMIRDRQRTIIGNQIK